MRDIVCLSHSGAADNAGGDLPPEAATLEIESFPSATRLSPPLETRGFASQPHDWFAFFGAPHRQHSPPVGEDPFHPSHRMNCF